MGVNEQAERMLKAFVSRGLELRLDDIKYHAQGKDNAIESLTGISSARNDDEVWQNIKQQLWTGSKWMHELIWMTSSTMLKDKTTRLKA